MMKAKAIKLHFLSPLHLHSGKPFHDKSQKVWHSDSILSAVCSKLHESYHDFDSFSFMNSIRVSSAFPFSGKEYFFPKPMKRLPVRVNFGTGEQEVSRESKALKKLMYLGKDYFEKVISTSEAFSVDQDLLELGKGQYLTSESVLQVPLTSSLQQRVKVSAGADSVPYYVDRVYFAEGAGLFFLADGKDDNLQLLTEGILMLGDDGIGTDRGVGNGQFETEVVDFELTVPDSDHAMTLSLFCPTEEAVSEGLLRDASYQLVQRGGVIAGATNPAHRHLRRKSVYMFTEGSVFPADKMKGKVVDLRPEWNDDTLGPVWRSGQPFSIPIISSS